MAIQPRSPSLSQPVSRIGLGQLPESLRELSEEMLVGSSESLGVGASSPVPCILCCSSCVCAFEDTE